MRTVFALLPVGLVALVALGAGLRDRATPGTTLGTVDVASQYDGGPVSIAIDAPRRHVFVGSSSTAGPLGVPRGGLVTILDADTGSIVRRVPVPGGAAAIAVDAATGRAFVADAALSMTVARPTGHLLQMLDTRNGALLRTIRLGLVPLALGIDERSGRVFVAGPALDPTGAARGGAGRVAVLDARSGALLRIVAVGAMPRAVIIAARSARVFVLDGGSNSVSVLDARSGRPLRTVPLPGSPCGPVGLDYPCIGAVDERALHVFFAVNVPNAPAGMVEMLDARSGTVLRGTAIPSFPYAVAIDPRARHLFVAAPIPGRADGIVRILDTATGRLTGSVAVGGVPLELAVDARTDRVYVLETAGVRHGLAALVPQAFAPPWPDNTLSVLDARSGTPSSPACAPKRSASSTQRGDIEYAARPHTLPASPHGLVTHRRRRGTASGGVHLHARKPRCGAVCMQHNPPMIDEVLILLLVTGFAGAILAQSPPPRYGSPGGRGVRRGAVSVLAAARRTSARRGSRPACPHGLHRQRRRRTDHDAGYADGCPAAHGQGRALPDRHRRRSAAGARLRRRQRRGHHRLHPAQRDHPRHAHAAGDDQRPRRPQRCVAAHLAAAPPAVPAGRRRACRARPGHELQREERDPPRRQGRHGPGGAATRRPPHPCAGGREGGAGDRRRRLLRDSARQGPGDRGYAHRQGAARPHDRSGVRHGPRHAPRPHVPEQLARTGGARYPQRPAPAQHGGRSGTRHGTDHLYIATRSRDEQLEVVRVRLPAGHPTQIVRLGPYPPATAEPTLLTLDAPRKWLYLSVGLRILVLDAATCRQIAAIPLPFAFSILALDPSTGHLLVAGEDPPGRRWQSS